MKKLQLIFSVLFLCFALTTFAQTEKGNLLIGGTAGFSAQFNDFNDIFSMNLSPGIGFFIEDGIVIGGNMGFGYTKIDESTGTSFGLIPFGRYYFNRGGSPAFFLQAKAGFIVNRTENNFNSNTSFGGVFGAGPGMAIFLSDQIAIEGILDLVRYAGDFRYTDLAFRFGVQAYLNRNN